MANDLRAYMPRSVADETAARELILWAENTSDLYPQRTAIAANLGRKMQKGTYRHELAPKAWGHLVDSAAKSYGRQFGGARKPGGIPTYFSKATRDRAASLIADSERKAIAGGEWDFAMKKPARRAVPRVRRLPRLR